MRTTLCLATIALSSACSFAQQDPASSMFWNTLLHTNPATAGLEYRHEAHAQYRNQWDEVNGAPNTLWVNYAARIDKIHGSAGISYEHDAIGFNRQNLVLAHYAFHLPVKNSVLSAGISAGCVNFGTSPDWVPPSTIDDPALPSSTSATSFTMNAGLVFHAPKWNAGFSVRNLNAPRLRMVTPYGSVSYSAARHYYLFADYRFALSENWSLQPRAIAVTDAVKYQAQLAVVGGYKKAWFGVHYRTSDSGGLFAGYDFYGRYRLGYLFEWTTNALSSVSRGTHEITLGFLLK